MADPALFLRRLRKKVLKRYAQNVFFPGWWPQLLRWCGYAVGDEVYIADGLVIVDELSESGNLTIGDRVSIAPRVTLVTSSHPNNSRIRAVLPGTRGPIEIGADAWIGAGAVVLPGVRVGRGAVVGASSVVTRDVPDLHVVAGQPASVIRTLSAPEGWA